MDRWRDGLVMLWGTVGAVLGGAATILGLVYGFRVYGYSIVVVAYLGELLSGWFNVRPEDLMGRIAASLALGVIVLMTVLGYVVGATLGERLIPKSIASRNARIARSLSTKR